MLSAPVGYRRSSKDAYNRSLASTTKQPKHSALIVIFAFPLPPALSRGATKRRAWGAPLLSFVAKAKESSQLPVHPPLLSAPPRSLVAGTGAVLALRLAKVNHSWQKGLAVIGLVSRQPLASERDTPLLVAAEQRSLPVDSISFPPCIPFHRRCHERVYTLFSHHRCGPCCNKLATTAQCKVHC